MSQLKIAVVVGSLRKESHNKALAGALAKLAPSDVSLERVEIGDLPLYNQDDDGAPSPQVTRVKAAISAAAGVIFVTPEYNRSIPGVLKNALDIASRPYGKSSFQGRVLGFFGTSPGAHGGVSAVKHLQQIMPGISGPIMQQPEAYAGMLADAFDAAGDVSKDSLKQFLTSYIQAFAAWVELHKK
jgi:chromate reductase